MGMNSNGRHKNGPGDGSAQNVYLLETKDSQVAGVDQAIQLNLKWIR